VFLSYHDLRDLFLDLSFSLRMNSGIEDVKDLVVLDVTPCPRLFALSFFGKMLRLFLLPLVDNPFRLLPLSLFGGVIKLFLVVLSSNPPSAIVRLSYVSTSSFTVDTSTCACKLDVTTFEDAATFDDASEMCTLFEASGSSTMGGSAMTGPSPATTAAFEETSST